MSPSPRHATAAETRATAKLSASAKQTAKQSAQASTKPVTKAPAANARATKGAAKSAPQVAAKSPAPSASASTDAAERKGKAGKPSSGASVSASQRRGRASSAPADASPAGVVPDADADGDGEAAASATPVAGAEGSPSPAAISAPELAPEPKTAVAVAETVGRAEGPAGSLVLVEPNPALPLVDVIVAFRHGAGEDPRHKDGLANFAAEAARRGAGDRDRAALEAALEALGATLEVEVTTDAVTFEGHVLARHLETYLALLADVLLRPRFDAAEVEKARRDVVAGIDEQRTNDHALCARFFARNVYGDHPYGRPADGTTTTLARLERRDLAAWFKRQVVGPNLIFAAAGPLDTTAWRAAVNAAFGALPAGPVPPSSPLPLRRPQGPSGWRLQLVDKPERRQVQIMFGQPTVAPAHPEYLALEVATSSFGGHGMTATLMNELRTQRGLVYGAYADLHPGRHASAIEGWAFTREENVVQALKLILRSYLKWAESGLDAERLATTKAFLIGSRAALWDDPGMRLKSRVKAEWQGRPADWIEQWPGRVQALSLAEVNAAVRKLATPKDLAITLVGTAASLMKRLTSAKIAGNAIDVFPFTVDDPKTAPGMPGAGD